MRARNSLSNIPFVLFYMMSDEPQLLCCSVTELNCPVLVRKNRRQDIRRTALEQPRALPLPSAPETILTMFRFRSRKKAQRKYVDLIKGASAKWPNWDPPKQILVSIAINSWSVSAFLTVPLPHSLGILVSSTKRQESWRSKEIFIPMSTPCRSPVGILPFLRQRWINSRSIHTKYGE